MPLYDDIDSPYNLIVDGSPHTVSLTTIGSTTTDDELDFLGTTPAVWVKLDLSGNTTGHKLVTINMVRTGGSATFYPDGFIMGSPYMGFKSSNMDYLEYFPYGGDEDYYLGDGTVDPPPITRILGGGRMFGRRWEQHRSADGVYYMPIFSDNGQSGTADFTYTVADYTAPTGNNGRWASATLLSGAGTVVDDTSTADTEDYYYRWLSPKHLWYKWVATHGSTFYFNFGDGIPWGYLSAEFYFDPFGAESQFDLDWTGVTNQGESTHITNAKAGTYYMSIATDYDDPSAGEVTFEYDIGVLSEPAADPGVTSFSRVGFAD